MIYVKDINKFINNLDVDSLSLEYIQNRLLFTYLFIRMTDEQYCEIFRLYEEGKQIDVSSSIISREDIKDFLLFAQGKEEAQVTLIEQEMKSCKTYSFD